MAKSAGYLRAYRQRRREARANLERLNQSGFDGPSIGGGGGGGVGGGPGTGGPRDEESDIVQLERASVAAVTPRAPRAPRAMTKAMKAKFTKEGLADDSLEWINRYAGTTFTKPITAREVLKNKAFRERASVRLTDTAEMRRIIAKTRVGQSGMTPAVDRASLIAAATVLEQRALKNGAPKSVSTQRERNISIIESKKLIKTIGSERAAPATSSTAPATVAPVTLAPQNASKALGGRRVLEKVGAEGPRPFTSSRGNVTGNTVESAKRGGEAFRLNLADDSLKHIGRNMGRGDDFVSPRMVAQAEPTRLSNVTLNESQLRKRLATLRNRYGATSWSNIPESDRNAMVAYATQLESRALNEQYRTLAEQRTRNIDRTSQKIVNKATGAQRAQAEAAQRAERDARERVQREALKAEYASDGWKPKSMRNAQRVQLARVAGITASSDYKTPFETSSNLGGPYSLNGKKLGTWGGKLEHVNHSGLTKREVENALVMSGIPKNVDASQLSVRRNGGSINVYIQHNGLLMSRNIDTQNGSVYNAHFKIDESHSNSYKGRDIFHNQIKTMEKAGYYKLSVSAAGSGATNNNPGDYNGYYTWLRFGYKPSAANSQDMMSKFRQFWGDVPGINEPRDFMTHREKKYANWWNDQGTGFSGSFDTRKSSQQRKDLETYVRKSKATAKKRAAAAAAARANGN